MRHELGKISERKITALVSKGKYHYKNKWQDYKECRKDDIRQSPTLTGSKKYTNVT